MKYYEVNFQLEPQSEDMADILSALIAELGFETFEYTPTGLRAYIQRELMDEQRLNEIVSNFPVPGIRICYLCTDAPDEDWNEEWEKEGFQPILIGDSIGVHDTKHAIPPVKYDILIHPRQAFGTGSHQTTRMILTQLSEMDLRGKSVIDAGTGTGILAIMAMKRGAAKVKAYDIDEWSVENAQQNLLLNGIRSGVEILLGDAGCIEEERDNDLLIANINRNILLADIPTFLKTLKREGKMILSGFYEDDIPILLDKAKSLGFSLKGKRNEEEWAMLLLEADATGRMDV